MKYTIIEYFNYHEVNSLDAFDLDELIFVLKITKRNQDIKCEIQPEFESLTSIFDQIEIDNIFYASFGMENPFDLEVIPRKVRF